MAIQRVTLATIGDLIALSDVPEGTMVSWHQRGRLGEPDATVSGTGIYVWDRIVPVISGLRPGVIIDRAGLRAHRRRASVASGSVLLGVQEAAQLVGIDPEAMRNYTSNRTKAPVADFAPAARLGPATASRQLQVFTAGQFRDWGWPGFSEKQAATLAASNTVGARPRPRVAAAAA